jgi:hypothetical protein
LARDTQLEQQPLVERLRVRAGRKIGEHGEGPHAQDDDQHRHKQAGIALERPRGRPLHER